jgi:hypothetical protein
MNKMEFRGYDKIVGEYGNKEYDEYKIPKLYSEKRYDEIIKYIKNEYECTLKFMKEVYKTLINKRKK